MIIGKLGFGKDDFFYGMELCLDIAGREAYPVTEKTACAVDVLLVTVFWYLDAYTLESFLRKAGIPKQAKERPIIIVGGMQATMTPEPFAALVDYVFIGDADQHLGSILDAIEKRETPPLDHLYQEGDVVIPKPAECDPSGFAINKGGKRGTWRIEIARGCRFKCSFCALSGLKSYREVSAESVCRTLDTIPKGAPVVLFAPERYEHSEWATIDQHITKNGFRDLGSDVRLENLPRYGKGAANIGIEGPSERLRRSIRKKFSDAFILEKIGEWLDATGRIGMLTAYFVADIPGETRADYAELYDLFEKIEKEEWSRRLVLKPVLNPLSPKPFTPLSEAIIHPFRDYHAEWEHIIRKGGRGQWGFRCVETLVWGPFERIRDVIVERGKADAGRFIKSLPDKMLTWKPPVSDREKIAVATLERAASFGMNCETLGIETGKEF